MCKKPKIHIEVPISRGMAWWFHCFGFYDITKLKKSSEFFRLAQQSHMLCSFGGGQWHRKQITNDMPPSPPPAEGLQPTKMTRWKTRTQLLTRIWVQIFRWFHCLFLHCHWFFIKKLNASNQKHIHTPTNEWCRAHQQMFWLNVLFVLLNNAFNIHGLCLTTMLILTHDAIFPFLLLFCRSCIIGPQLEVKVCTLGTVINRTAYPSDYCQLEGTGRQSQPMPIRWMSWESVLLVSSILIFQHHLHAYFWPRLGHHHARCGGFRVRLAEQIFDLHFLWNYVNRNAKGWANKRARNGDEPATQFHYAMRYNPHWKQRLHAYVVTT